MRPDEIARLMRSLAGAQTEQADPDEARERRWRLRQP